MNNTFNVNQTVPYDLRKRNVLQSRNPSSVRYRGNVLHNSKNMDSCPRSNQKL